MIVQGVPPKQDGLGIAVELVSSPTLRGSLVDGNERFLGIVNEFDILWVLEIGKGLCKPKAADILNRAKFFFTESTPLAEAVRIMKKDLLVLPVVKDGAVMKSITCHDLLRAWFGLGVGVEE